MILIITFLKSDVFTAVNCGCPLGSAASDVQEKEGCSLYFFPLKKSLTFSSDIDMLEEFAYLRTQEGGKIHLELLPNQGMLIK